MRVKAKLPNNQFGFYEGVRRFDGDEFVLSDEKHFSDKWMEKLDSPKKTRTRKPKEEPEKAEEGAE